MASNTLKTRIILNNKTNAEWTSDAYKTFVPLKGEICIYSDLRKIKIGDGTFLNVSKSGISVSQKAGKTTINSRGTTTINLGNGVTYRTSNKKKKK